MSGFELSKIENHAYKLLVNEVKDIAIFFMDPEGRIESWNEGAERLKGYTEKEVIGEHYRILFTDEQVREKHPEEELEIAKKDGRFEAEEFRKRKDGSHFRAHVILTRQLDRNNKLLGFFKITRDVTERYYREKETSVKSAEIERLSQLKDEFIGIASHELRNPLTTVKAYLQLLKKAFTVEENVKKQYKDYIGKSYNQISKLEKLISELLNASRIGSGKLEINISEFDLSKLIFETVENIKHIYPKQEITFASSKKLVVRADRDRIEQVVVNYLTNAIRYSPAESEIAVAVRAVDNMAEVSVKDQGIGISKEDQDKIFSRFFRSKENGKKAGGLGLGLYIVKGIINQHNGEVSVESEPGKGSCFYFTIPVNKP